MLGLLALTLLTAAPPPLTTLAERSGWKQTGRYAEVETLCHAFAKRFPRNVRCEKFGTTPERRPMLALVASADGAFTPKAARLKKRPVVFLQGGIHAGEIDGKDAGFWLLRDLLEGKALPGALKKLTVIFVPVFNVDGHERFGKNHRPNQVGPEEMGWRVNAQNLNLNRDYVKTDTLEMEAMLRFLDRWDPALLMDLHVTDGARFQPDVAVILEPNLAGPAGMRAVGRKAQLAIFDELRKEGHQPLEFYPSFIRQGDPASGFAQAIPPPRFFHGYWPLRNRFAVLVETHSWKDYATRVRTTRDVVLAVLERAMTHAPEWIAAEKKADASDRAEAKANLGLAWTHDAAQTAIDFPGYHYVRKPSPISGELGITYDTSRPELWHVPFFPAVKPAQTAASPQAGWVIPVTEARWLKEKLTLHGFRYTTLRKALTLEVQAYRASGIHFANTSYEGHQRLSTEGAWRRETQVLPAGSIFVPSRQAGQALLAQLFTPNAPDALLSWGFFNAFFEQKEYIEPYVLEPWAEALLARDSKVKAAFGARMKDPRFANDPEERLRFFAELHPSWDRWFGLYPVFRVDEVPGK